ncbi:hypothetical protein [Bacillus sp. PK3_68]|uniref:hypothetical protein n=1 Tax=Bacillus sp. PK3_68 TaxID=2027408 RepID=UPI000E716C11|nr:hypothetical protein [Bacillus sp. PK3_68]RJS59240.1 hypothetical protein CJ483_03470 [Bacillus sp. PK3_68]
MKRYWKVIISTVLLLVGFTALKPTAEAAKNPITPQQSRVTYTLKDANGVPYKIYFAGVREKKAIASTDRNDWASANNSEADKGDLLYTGNYTLYTHNPKTSHIKKSNFYYKSYLLNATRKMVYTVPSRYKGQPDMLMVAYSMGDGYEGADWFYMRNGILTQIIYGDTLPHSKRPQVIGKNKYQTAMYDPDDRRWYFANITVNPTKATQSRTFPEYNHPGAVLRNWKKHWQ